MVTINNKITLNAHVYMQFLAFILQTYLSHDILLYFYRMKRFLAFSMRAIYYTICVSILSVFILCILMFEGPKED